MPSLVSKVVSFCSVSVMMPKPACVSVLTPVLVEYSRMSRMTVFSCVVVERYANENDDYDGYYLHDLITKKEVVYCLNEQLTMNKINAMGSGHPSPEEWPPSTTAVDSN